VIAVVKIKAKLMLMIARCESSEVRKLMIETIEGAKMIKRAPIPKNLEEALEVLKYISNSGVRYRLGSLFNTRIFYVQVPVALADKLRAIGWTFYRVHPSKPTLYVPFSAARVLAEIPKSLFELLVPGNSRFLLEGIEYAFGEKVARGITARIPTLSFRFNIEEDLAKSIGGIRSQSFKVVKTAGRPLFVVAVSATVIFDIATTLAGIDIVKCLYEGFSK
jgi:hypothetical protein